MNAREANVFLTKASIFDPRMKRVDPVEQADMATAWAEILPEVALIDALDVLAKHYRAQTSTLMPADILSALGVVDTGDSVLIDVTEAQVEDDKVRRLAEAGVTAVEFEAHKSDLAWLKVTFPWAFTSDAVIEALDENGDPE